MNTITYRGFQIDTVFKYSSGKSDFQFFEINNPENSGIAPSCSVSDVKEQIDDRLDGREQYYFVQVTRSWMSCVKGLDEAMKFASFWKGNLIADFKNP